MPDLPLTKNCYECTNKSSCFRKLEKSELDFIDDKRVEIIFKQGETLIKQGSFATYIMYLKSGLVKHYIEGKDKELILAIYGEGNLIGIPSLYGNNLYDFSVVAYEDAVACQIDINIFRNFAEKNASFSSEVIKICNIGTSKLYERFFSVTYKNIAGRFADTIIYLYENIFKVSKFKIPLSRKDMAEFGGMSVESLSRIINDFKKDEILDISGKYIEILNLNKLYKISKSG